MFIGEDQKVNVTLAKHKGNYLLLKTCMKPFPDSYEAVSEIKKTPKAIVDLLNIPLPLETNLKILLEEKKKADEYSDKISQMMETLVEAADYKIDIKALRNKSGE